MAPTAAGGWDRVRRRDVRRADGSRSDAGLRGIYRPDACAKEGILPLAGAAGQAGGWELAGGIREALHAGGFRPFSSRVFTAPVETNSVGAGAAGSPIACGGP